MIGRMDPDTAHQAFRSGAAWPRHKSRKRARKRRRTNHRQVNVIEPQPSYEQIARGLVRDGLCSRLILDRPDRFTPQTSVAPAAGNR